MECTSGQSNAIKCRRSRSSTIAKPIVHASKMVNETHFWRLLWRHLQTQISSVPPCVDPGTPQVEEFRRVTDRQIELAAEFLLRQVRPGLGRLGPLTPAARGAPRRTYGALRKYDCHRKADTVHVSGVVSKSWSSSCDGCVTGTSARGTGTRCSPAARSSGPVVDFHTDPAPFHLQLLPWVRLHCSF